MPDDHPVGEQTATVLDLAFNSGMLDALRAEVKANARQAGLSEDRAEDVVLAVHELAANAVHHGAGTGRLHAWKQTGALHCQVEDGDPPPAGDPAEQRASPGGGGTADAAESSGQAAAIPLPRRPGHGLWVVRQLADRMQVLSDARGTCVTVTFNLPG